MIRVRRVAQRVPIGRKYEVEYEPRLDGREGWRRTTRAPIGVLQPLLGMGDAWSLVQAADTAWDRGNREWAVEFEEAPTPDRDLKLGDRLRLFGGYDFEPAWLGGRDAVFGTITRWIPGQNAEPACVVALDEPLTATGTVKGETRTVTGRVVILEQRSVGASWVDHGTVYVELCDFVPEKAPWPDRHVGAWVESHGSYQRVSGDA